jgi:hypothetical protein
MALAAIADDADLLALDEVQVGVAIVINTHGRSSWLAGRSARIVMFSEWSAGRSEGRSSVLGRWQFPGLSSPFFTSGETRFCMTQCRIMRP